MREGTLSIQEPGPSWKELVSGFPLSAQMHILPLVLFFASSERKTVHLAVHSLWVPYLIPYWVCLGYLSLTFPLL